MTSPLPEDWEVPAAIRERIGELVGRQRTMVADDQLLIILHELPDPNEPDVREARLFWRAKHGAWRTTAGEDDVSALEAHVARYGERLAALEDRVETARSSEHYFAVLHEVLPLRRATRNMHAALQAARDASEAARELITLRDRAYDLERAAELVHGFARDGLDFIVARESELQAQASRRAERAAHRLNQLAALTLPITAVASLLGTNLVHGFETKFAPWLFWCVAMACVGAGFAVRAAIERER